LRDNTRSRGFRFGTALRSRWGTGIRLEHVQDSTFSESTFREHFQDRHYACVGEQVLVSGTFKDRHSSLRAYPFPSRHDVHVHRRSGTGGVRGRRSGTGTRWETTLVPESAVSGRPSLSDGHKAHVRGQTPRARSRAGPSTIIRTARGVVRIRLSSSPLANSPNGQILRRQDPP
jgi:hypothetical protein